MEFVLWNGWELRNDDQAPGMICECPSLLFLDRPIRKLCVQPPPGRSQSPRQRPHPTPRAPRPPPSSQDRPAAQHRDSRRLGLDQPADIKFGSQNSNKRKRKRKDPKQHTINNAPPLTDPTSSPCSAISLPGTATHLPPPPATPCYRLHLRLPFPFSSQSSRSRH